MNTIPILALNFISYHVKQKLISLPFSIVPFINQTPYKILTWALCCYALLVMIKDNRSYTFHKNITKKIEI
jgi:hypothetical protein